MSTSSNGAEKVLRNALRNASLKMMAVFLIAFFLLELFILHRTRTEGFEKVEQWIATRKPQIEQALFLENNLSVNGIVKNFSTEMPTGVNAKIAVFNSSYNRIEGNLDFPEQIHIGIQHSLFTNTFLYFDELKFGDQIQGYIFISGSVEYSQLVFHSILTLIFILGMFAVFNSLLKTFVKVTTDQILEPIYQLRKHIAGSSKADTLTAIEMSPSSATTEVLELVKGYNSLVEHIHNQQKDLSQMAGQKAVAMMAKQVAHDIRSPLTALNMIAASRMAMPENERTILRSAIKRISDIANHLMGKELEDGLAMMNRPENSTELISGLVAAIATEKRMQYRLDDSVKIEEHYTPEASRIFSSVNAVEFKRAISNIIDNAKEAAREGAVQIAIDVRRVGAKVVISISDDGIGMSSLLLTKVGQQGFTFGKSSGSGLGLSHAIQCFELWGGQVKIESMENIGTTIHAVLPMAEPPQWFVDSIPISTRAEICIVDDDDAIHYAWKQVLEGHPRQEAIHHFKTIAECEQHLRDSTAKEVLFFADFELGGDQNGLNFLVEQSSRSGRYLVTSHWEDKNIRKVVMAEQIKLIPKVLVPYLTISYEVIPETEYGVEY